jgi:uncharacterized protein YceK
MKYIFLVIVTLTFTGCAGMWSRAMMPEPPLCGIFFGGVIVDVREIMMDTSEPWVVAGGVVDLPFNLMADVVLVPYDLYQLQRANYVYCSHARSGNQMVMEHEK